MTLPNPTDRTRADEDRPHEVPAPLDLAGWVAELEEFAREVTAELEEIRRGLGDADVSAVSRNAAGSAAASSQPARPVRPVDGDLVARRNSMQERLARLAGDHPAAGESNPGTSRSSEVRP